MIEPLVDTNETRKKIDDLEKKIKEQEQELIKYKEIRKPGYVYVIKTDGGMKIGHTKNTVSKRIKGLQTGNVNDIKIIFDYPTSNADLLERCVHYVLDKYRYNSKREYFNCNVEYIKTVIKIIGKVIDILKSCCENSTQEEIVLKLKDVDIDINIVLDGNEKIEQEQEQQVNNFYNWLEKNIEEKQDAILQLSNVCKIFMGKKVGSRTLAKYKKEIEKYIKKKYKHITYEYRKIDKNYRGWKNLAIKEI